MSVCYSLQKLALCSTRATGGARSRSSAPAGPSRSRKSLAVTAFSGAVMEMDKMTEYNKSMAERMNWGSPFEYHPERGLYYHYISSDVIVGSQPMTPADVDRLAVDEGVRAILNLQQDKDLHYWNVDLHQISRRAEEHGIEFIRTPAVDFDPNSLRATLPRAVAAMERARTLSGKVYVHCTAGLGRSPAVAIAALYWFTSMQLDDAYKYLTGIRPCGPNKDAIRGATYDLLSGEHWDGFSRLPGHAFASLSEADRQVVRRKLLGDC